MTWAIIGAASIVAFANGANDNFNGVATIYGSGTASYRRSLSWATLTTLAGGVIALLVADGLVEAFSGAGLVPEATADSGRFLVAVGIGAGATVALASIVGMPISTTHALVGGLAGAGVAAAGSEIDATTLVGAFLLPLIAGPILALALTGALYPILRFGRQRLGIRRETCVCVASEWVPMAALAATGEQQMALVEGQRLTVATGTMSECAERYDGTLLGLSAQRAVDLTHFLSAGAVSFARGLNDTPKIAALLITANAVDANVSLWMVGIVMGVGGVLGARRVAETMSHRVTSMSPGQGLVANVSAAFLVIVASRYALPVSTTHVTSSGLFAIGAETGQARWPMITAILAAWLTTLPLAAVLGALTYLAFGL